jgi:hypothetical protein
MTVIDPPSVLIPSVRDYKARIQRAAEPIKLSSLMRLNQCFVENFGAMRLVFEEFICGFQTRNCR